ncbi:mediator of RNA polymerase II transcription subunit 6, putative [Plasmodium berghei]|uniref:Mediator of RNA polymerase II transcription subunit 6 n=2 Tax=Plasmodium berghei TaxID=5821 RepID=A0A509ASA8_PLABA|nr:mediator of RNA polymerase II transcription subunit 6, putative [Plasmodium berghei ANKA]CXI96707.1 mediator of RNA polymerase II transcription subunit 6, putative [Plasmodium berghei]SCL97385.1 mediator of RNA polymerase II transcription subunit 6, putative [Plasmodium berghei]SCM16604.1 mediator of RNA polymerase II transcription subunit 6, putative [Plasmodium berghei]SCM18401.1 mediator of RNA polymerase II transcription subunit 6, putative [Plasmodium berghei]SCN27831.1 mediator of RNA|eukprot:XP_034423485.1 mediator of RNA polymerase II transcription subunit 6, putative [Plasmodium berghei ANKA]
MGEVYYESELKKDNKIEYVDNIFLSKNILNNRENALNYFYTSPFYTSKSHISLNEKIRVGKIIGEEDEGYLFDISYDNLDVLKKDEPTDGASIHIYYNTNSIYHIRLTHIYKLKNIFFKKVIQMFCVFNGKIYSSRSFGELLINKINNIVRNIENFYERVNNMMNFNITSNYYFENKTRLKKLDDSHKNFSLDDFNISITKKKKNKQNCKNHIFKKYT